jgi:hypothetical protein
VCLGTQKSFEAGNNAIYFSTYQIFKFCPIGFVIHAINKQIKVLKFRPQASLLLMQLLKIHLHPRRIPEITAIFSWNVSSTIAFTLVSQSSIQLVSQEGNLFF